MPEPKLSDLSTPHRMHWSSVVMGLIHHSRRSLLALIPAVPGLLVINSPFLRVGFAALLVVMILYQAMVKPTIRFIRTRFYIDGDSLILEGGLWFRWRRVLPRARIQSVDVVEKIWHRIFQVAELRIEAVGGSSTEARLDAVDPELGRELKAWALMAGTTASSEQPVPILAQSTPGDLVIAGLTGGRVAVLAAFFGYLFQLVPEEALDEFFQSASERLAGIGGSPSLVVMGLAVAVLLLAFAISVIRTVVIFWEFTVARQGARLVITRGLIERRQATVPIHRVQSVTISENPVRRLFGLAAAQLLVAGYAGESKEVERSSVLWPLGPRDRVRRLAGDVLGRSLPEVGEMMPAPRRALWARLTAALLTAATAGVVLASLFGPLGMLGLLSATPFSIAAYSSWRFLGHYLSEELVAVSSGLMTRRTTLIPTSNIQHLRLRAHPFQKAFGLCSLDLALPRKSFSALGLDRGVGERRFAYLEALLSGAGTVGG